MIGHSFPTLEEMPYIPTMPKNRIIPAVVLPLLVALFASAQEPAPPVAGGAPAGPAAEAAPPEPPTPAEELLDAAIKKVVALTSVSADIQQQAEMLGQRFDVKGRYLKAPNNRVYLRLAVSGLAKSTGTMLQVCDGETLWDFQQVLESQNYHTLKIAPILEKLKSPELDDALREQVMTQLGFSGPDALLVGLRKALRFDQKEEGTLDGKAVWILRGTWKDREGLIGPDQQPLPPTASLPAYIPSLATVWIGKEDGWPYKVVLVGKVPSMLQEDSRQLGADGRPKATQKVQPSRIILTYSNVQLNATLKPEEFAFQAPPGVRVDDNTEALLNALEQTLQARIAQKKQEAAKAEPLLDQSIEVPRSGELPTLPPLPRSPHRRPQTAASLQAAKVLDRG